MKRDRHEEAPPVVTLWGREWTREELLARVGHLEQIAGIRLVEGGDGAAIDAFARGAGDLAGQVEAPARRSPWAAPHGPYPRGPYPRGSAPA